MDNTRVISSNGTPYEKMFKGPNALTSQKSAALTGQQQQHFDHRKGFAGGNGGVDGNVISQLMYTTCNGNGQAQILMNTQSIKTATQMQFLPPTRTKSTTLSTSMHCLPAMQPIKVATASSSVQLHFMTPQSEQLIMSKSDTILSQYPNVYHQPQSGPETIVTKPSFAFAHAQISSSIAPSTIVHSYQFIKRTSGPIIEQNPKFFNQDNHKTTSQANMQTTMTTTTTTAMATAKTATKTGESKTFMNSFKKCVFDYVIKPIIDTTTMFVGTDNSGKTTRNNENIWNHHDRKVTPGAGGCGVGGSGGNGSPTTKAHMKSSTSKLYSDCSNHSSDSICFMSENPNYFTNYMPDNEFFDCDDYIDGGEDTIDFVADSTNLQYNRFGSELNLNTSAFVDQSPSKDHIFYDCVNKCETPEVAIDLVQESKQQRVADEYLDVVCNEKITNDSADIVKNVQYNDVTDEEEVIIAEKLPLNCPKYERSNPKSYRRKRRGKRKQQQNHQKKHHKANNRAMKGNAQKNRHEKIRHEVEQNIHEDIDDCSVVKDYCIPDDDDDDDDVDVDLEIIDVDGEHLPESPSNSLNTTPTTIPATKSTSICTIETPPSPETIKSGCIFTKFFRLDNSNSKQKSWLPLRCMQQKYVPIQSKQSLLRERPVTCRRTSETSESDDSFIVFEDNNSPRSTASIDDLIASKSTASLKDTYKRQRQISECSDDFILFEEDTDDLCRRYTDTTDEDFTDSTDDSDNSEDESGDESDSSDCSSISQRKHDGESNQPDSGFEEKKVTFNLCPTVHEIRAWKFAYSQARKGKWEQMGRDRERFEKRISGLSRVLSPILAPEHRQKIYEQRFRSDD